ncbi:mechanosensitive ion channel family protein [Marinoscillum sp. MHG1-6]|uniref:mechanosensitive ion channel family protein n=1 Tax=Marinoscillum sp. MHG1-6 TaxID=2959627 RepID=UPI0021578764|nr:mechanosensitive ion channel domain-containing protein [Marinoscillum sp. MHG1-6]
MDKVNEIWSDLLESVQSFIEVFSKPLFNLGEGAISMGTILYFAIAFFLLSFISKKLRRILVENVLTRTQLEPGVRASIGTVLRFLVIVIGSVIIIQTAGIDLSALSILAGALGVGIGFGLQNITDNFISGIIILFEKPIKVGDRIEVGDVQGDVMNISFRATEIRTNDNITIIVPNSEFISSQVINWSHNDRNIRFRIPVGVSYKEDPAKIKKILLAVAKDNPHVLDNPESTVLFDEYGDSSINFYLAVWTTTHTDKPRVLKSELYFEIFKRFGEEGVEIPFPQRDIHIISTPNGTANPLN